MAVFGAVAVHAALFAWHVAEVPEEPRLDVIEIEFLEIGPEPTEVDADADVEMDVDVDVDALEPEPEPRPKKKITSKPQEQEAEQEQEQEHEPDPDPDPDLDPGLDLDPDPDPSPVQVQGQIHAQVPTAAPASKRTGTRGKPHDPSYGAEIANLVIDELRRNPVRGIGPTHTIQVLLEIQPNGELVWKRDGRYGFVRVLRSSLGKGRTRRVLKRIERASYRFPKHPPGLKCKRCTVDVTVNFRDL